jgi:hypothetical protein
MLMFVLTVIVAIVWALAHFHTISMSPNLADFFGGAAVGLGIGALVAWVADR